MSGRASRDACPAAVRYTPVAGVRRQGSGVRKDKCSSSLPTAPCPLTPLGRIFRHGKGGIMRKAHWGLAALAGAIVLTLSWTGPARSQRPVVLDPLPRDLAKQAEVNEADVAKVLSALGPAIARQIAAGPGRGRPGPA